MGEDEVIAAPPCLRRGLLRRPREPLLRGEALHVASLLLPPNQACERSGFFVTDESPQETMALFADAQHEPANEVALE